MTVSVAESSGNIFADLELPDPEGRMAKARLAYAISQAMQKRGLTQAATAELLGISQPEVSNIMRGKLGNITYDRLFSFLTALGYEVQVSVGERRPGAPGIVTTLAP